MTNWANRNVGEVVLAGFGVLAAAAIAFAFNVGQNATTLQQVQNELRAQGNVLASLRQHIDDRFDQLESRFDITQTDLTREHEKSGISNFINILQQMREFTCVEFGIDDIVRSGLVKSYLVTKYNLGF